MTNSLRRIFVSAAVAAATLVGWVASAQTFSNPGSISIPTIGTAKPYSAPIGVTGAPVTFSSMSVTLTNFNHTFSSDVAVMLVGPTGGMWPSAGSGNSSQSSQN